MIIKLLGAERRKKKTVHKQSVTDDTKLMTMLKKYSKQWNLNHKFNYYRYASIPLNLRGQYV